jgi:hypothetical protein
VTDQHDNLGLGSPDESRGQNDIPMDIAKAMEELTKQVTTGTLSLKKHTQRLVIFKAITMSVVYAALAFLMVVVAKHILLATNTLAEVAATQKLILLLVLAQMVFGTTEAILSAVDKLRSKK